jgi:hypothetical protein
MVPETKSLFIVGTGRSGTHLLCETLDRFENAVDPLRGSENRDLLYTIALAAIQHAKFPSYASQYYKSEIHGNTPANIFIDQHHPNLFFTNELKQIDSTATFIYLYRPTVQIVASMLKHSGVLGWYKLAEQINYPIPNQYLGLHHNYTKLTMPTWKLCALRALQHLKKGLTLHRKGHVNWLDYRDLLEQPQEALRRCLGRTYQALGDATVMPNMKAASLSKYKSVLSNQQITSIQIIEKKIFSNMPNRRKSF